MTRTPRFSVCIPAKPGWTELSEHTTFNGALEALALAAPDAVVWDWYAGEIVARGARHVAA